MHLGQIQGLGAGGQNAQAAHDFIDAISGQRRSDYTDWSPSNVLDKRFAVKELVLYGVIGFVGYQLIRKWKRS